MPYLWAMGYNMKDRDRLEAYPKKGTKSALKKRAKQKDVSLVVLLNEILEKAANA